MFKSNTLNLEVGVMSITSSGEAFLLNYVEVQCIVLLRCESFRGQFTEQECKDEVVAQRVESRPVSAAKCKEREKGSALNSGSMNAISTFRITESRGNRSSLREDAGFKGFQRLTAYEVGFKVNARLSALDNRMLRRVWLCFTACTHSVSLQRKSKLINLSKG